MGSDEKRLSRTIVRIKYFHAFSAETVLGTGLDIGWAAAFGATPDVPLSERFFAGGPLSIRGFDYQRIGPMDDAHHPTGGDVKLVWNVAVGLGWPLLMLAWISSGPGWT